jgi:enoyl-CoA hydratase/carnithine racemase
MRSLDENLDLVKFFQTFSFTAACQGNRRCQSGGKPMMSEYQHWLLSEDAHIVTLTLNRPEVMNSLDAETMYELREITAQLSTNKDVWAVIVQGQGEHFSVGMDVRVIQEGLNQSEKNARESLLNLQGCLDDFEALEKPTIAKLQGFCIGGGLVMALCCDFRIASQRTIFSLPEVKRGLAVLMGTQRVTRVVGVAATKEMILLGKRFNAQEALAYGLVNRVVPPDELSAAVAELAEKFLKLPPRTVGIAKRIINKGHNMTMRESQDLEIDARAELLGSPDLQEAIESFLEKRESRFTGE